jgi:hypothetical protein
VAADRIVILEESDSVRSAPERVPKIIAGEVVQIRVGLVSKVFRLGIDVEVLVHPVEQFVMGSRQQWIAHRFQACASSSTFV